MKCNMNVSLGVISIILIIAIAILVLYRNYKDNNDNNNNNNNIEKFASQSEINNLISTILSKPTIGIISNSKINDNEFQNTVSDNIKLQSSSLASTYQSNNNIASNQITKLENTITDLENIISNKKLSKISKNNYSRIKSLNNGMEMDLVGTPNTIFKDTKTGKITNAYLVNVNNGCLSVGATDYDVYNCNDKNPKQFFKMQHIINETDYANNIDKALPFDNVDKSSINYPFTMIKSSNNDECLTNNHGTLTVQPCYSFEAQRWIPL